MIRPTRMIRALPAERKIFMDEFLLRALLGGLAVACIAGPFGCFVVWRRLAYFGDTLAHSALLGFALGFLVHMNLTLSIILVCQILAMLLFISQRGQSHLAGDTLLGILAHGSLSMGFIALSFIQGVRLDLTAYFFGDILSISHADFFWIFGCGGFALLILLKLWRPLLAITVHEDLARVQGIAVDRIHAIFLCLIALLVAIMTKIMGLLLVTALLVIPAATARRFAKTPETMAVLASLVGSLSVGAGLFASFLWDTPASPSIVVAACLFFVLSRMLR